MEIEKLRRKIEYIKAIKREVFSKEGYFLKWFQKEWALVGCNDKRIAWCKENGYPEYAEYFSKYKPYKMAMDENALFWIKDHPELINQVHYDKSCCMFYFERNNKRLYWRKDIDMLQMIEDYAYLCYEQSETSAHKYFDDDFDIHTNDIIADIGCAEALITLDYIDIIEHAYLFECNENWIEALKKTFEPWKNKVTIVNKFVGEKDMNDVISLDTFFKDKQIDLIKMDIEGNEIKALLGAQNLIKGDKPLKFAVCAYHGHDDEDNIIKLFKGFSITKSPGKLFTGCSEIPYFNTGVIRAVKL